MDPQTLIVVGTINTKNDSPPFMFSLYNSANQRPLRDSCENQGKII